MTNPKPTTRFNKPHFKVLTLVIGLFFNQRTSATTFYINDTSRLNDRYTNAIGKDTNDGRTPSTPKLSIDQVYQIANERDTIYVDTGAYPETQLTVLKENKRKVHLIMAVEKEALQVKNSLPTTVKTNPTEFYIENDKPVERSVYLKRKRNEAKKS